MLNRYITKFLLMSLIVLSASNLLHATNGTLQSVSVTYIRNGQTISNYVVNAYETVTFDTGTQYSVKLTRSSAGTSPYSYSLINFNTGAVFTKTGTSASYWSFTQLSGPGQYFARVDEGSQFTFNMVDATAVAPPDLIVPSLNLSQPSVEPSGSMSVTFSVKNQGGQDVNISFANRLYLSTNATWDGGDVQLYSHSPSGMTAGATRNYSSIPITIPSNTTPGSYYILAVADATSVVSETVETNNGRSASLTVSGSPDIVIQNLTVTPNPGAPGSQVTVSYTVKNQGNGPTNGIGVFANPVLWSTDSTITYGTDSEMANCNVGTLAAGATSACNVTATIPANAVVGTTYYIGVAGDALNTVSESNENNNKASTPFVPSGKPDIIIQNLTITPSNAEPGAQVTVGYTVKNQGNAAASSSFINPVLWSADAAIVYGADQQLANCPVASLAANGTTTCSYAITVPSSATAGTAYYIGVYGDATNVISESNESNNTASTTFVPVKPDVVIQNLTVAPNPAAPGSQVTVSYTVKNQGNGPTNGIGVFANPVLWSTDSTITYGTDTELANCNVSTLVAGGSSPCSVTATIPSGAAPGTTYYIGVAGDGVNGVAESNESNNTA
ncbi:MAG: hypothetical protein HY821_09030, partial [Acidobacteria bacterium]|nr:hypothetical protein [Acidobacteriota bacterium]